MPEWERAEPARAEELFKQSLLKSGLLKEVKTPSLSPNGEKRAPIQLKGKPLSQTIIAERR